MKYTQLPLPEIASEFAAMARDTRATFGTLDALQLNWRPDDSRWSVAQCFEHLLTSGELVVAAADRALDPAARPTIWQRLPVLPGVNGRLLIGVVSPEGKRRFTAPSRARPATSHIDPAILDRFVAFQDDATARVRALSADRAARTILISPFASFFAYSVLDAYRVIAAHQRRHFAQAQRVTETAGFPQSSSSGAS
jgi:hypothetical protein